MGPPFCRLRSPERQHTAFFWFNTGSLWGRNAVANAWAINTAIGDCILNSDLKLHFKTGSNLLSPVLTIDGSNVGIGTTAPNYKLDVNGTINATEIGLAGTVLAGTQWTTTAGSIYYNGNVGISTTTNNPGVRLDVNGIIESRTAIGASSSYYFTGVANSDLSRVTIAGQLSTGSALNDTVLRSTNK